MDNNSIKLKNFRVFDDKGAEFEIAPITILTGCNSSGKSSVTKALMLLNNYFERIKSDYVNGLPFNISEYALLFNKGKHNLGTYKKTISKFSNEKEMIFGWKRYSPLFIGEIEVELTFFEDTTNVLNNALIKDLRIKHEGRELVFLNFKDEFFFKINFLEIKDHFLDFANGIDYYNSIRNDLGKNEDNVPNLFQDEDQLNKSDIDSEKLRSYKYAIESLMIRDRTNTLINEINASRLNHRTLFYLPVLDWLQGVEKKRTSEIIFNKIYENEDRKPDLETINVINSILKDFIASDFSYFNDYFLHHENEFLQELSQKEFKSNPLISSDRTFIGKIHSELDLVSSLLNEEDMFFDPKFNFMKWEQTKENIKNNDDKKNKNYVLKSKFMGLSTFCFLDKDFCDERVKDYTNQKDSYNEYLSPKEANSALLYLIALIQDSFFNSPSFIGDIEYVDAVRINIQRLYTFASQGTEFNELLQKYLSAVGKNIKNDRFNPNPLNHYILGSFTKKYLKKFDIADDIVFENTVEGLGILIYLIKGKHKELLADKGYGITQLLPIFLQIELNIVKYEYEYQDSLSWNKTIKHKESTVSIEEPESHLHPKFQSMLADVFVDAYKTYNIRFIVETHSEYLVRKLQTMVAKKELTPDNVALNYIYHHNKSERPAGKPQVLNIKIKEDGRLSDPFGTGFFDEADNLAMDLLTLKSLN